jgi:outer membrane lipoprotein SlyB
MKKIISTLMMALVLGIAIPTLSSSAMAQTRYYSARNRTTTVYRKPSFYRRHRNVINMAIGTGAGALLGGVIGGKKGALIGTLAGAGGSALYTYKLNPKQRRYYRRY